MVALPPGEGLPYAPLPRASSCVGVEAEALWRFRRTDPGGMRPGWEGIRLEKAIMPMVSVANLAYAILPDLVSGGKRVPRLGIRLTQRLSCISVHARPPFTLPQLLLFIPAKLELTLIIG